MRCENCGIEHDGSYASGRFCSSKCSRSYSAKVNNSQRIAKIKAASALQPRPSLPKVKQNKVETYWYNYLREHYPYLKIEPQAKIMNPSIDNSNNFYRLDLLVEDYLDIEIDGYHPSSRGRDHLNDREQFLLSLGIITVRVKYLDPARHKVEVNAQIDSLMEKYFPGMKY
ncbi:MAG: hypothetical protein NC548_35340 [Lachnospiraceae bacterium]|nr:hypothetical protein [Lachnospiraceae bacterium]